MNTTNKLHRGVIHLMNNFRMMNDDPIIKEYIDDKTRCIDITNTETKTFFEQDYPMIDQFFDGILKTKPNDPTWVFLEKIMCRNGYELMHSGCSVYFATPDFKFKIRGGWLFESEEDPIVPMYSNEILNKYGWKQHDLVKFSA